eukprot:g174.t1
MRNHVMWRLAKLQLRQQRVELRQVTLCCAILFLRRRAPPSAAKVEATLVAVGAMTGKEPVLPKQLGFGANYRRTVFWRFHEVNLASHTWTILDEHAYFFRPIRLKHLKSGTDVQILGYRQSWRYFHRFQPKICTRFTLRGSDEELVAQMFAPIEDLLRVLQLTRQDTVSIHVRRGDYLRKPHIHPVLPAAYYQQAIKQVRRRLAGEGGPERPLLFVVFSDDIAYMISMAVILLPAAALATAATPPHATPVTFYNLRPYNLTSDIDEKNSADALGDIFFYITDRLITPYACRHYTGHKPFMCQSFQKRLQTGDQVYTELEVSVDSTWGGCPSGLENCSQYSDCNPTKSEALEAANCTEDLLQNECRRERSCSAPGKLEVASRYCGPINQSSGLCIQCADECDGPWSHWKSEVSRLGGEWYSTTSDGDCSNPSASKCSWLVTKKKKTINATCANNKIHEAVEKKGKECFSKCAQPTNSTSDCWILCFVETVLGRNPLSLTSVVGTPMTATELTTPWLAAFATDSPATGGCPALPPAPPGVDGDEAEQQQQQQQQQQRPRQYL